MKLKTTLAALIAAIALPVLAQPAGPARDPLATPGIDKREANQQQRIEQGIKSGELTQKEAVRLERDQERIKSMEAKAKADGKVTGKERERIERAQDRESRKIEHEKHDRQRDRDHDGKNDRREGKGPGHDRGEHRGEQRNHDKR